MTMSGSSPGSGEIGRLLKETGSPYDPQKLEALIEGVLSAPAEVGTSWHMLVADPTPPALAEALEALRAAKARGYRTGLDAEDFERLPRSARLDRLRQHLAAQGLDGFIVPRADEHQGEYVPPRGQRLAWLTGFTGSGRSSDRLARPRCVVRRWTLHPAGGCPGRHSAIRNPSPDRRTSISLGKRRPVTRRHTRL